MFKSTELNASARKKWLNWRVAAIYALVTVVVPLLSLVVYERNLSETPLLQHIWQNLERYTDILAVFGAFGVFGHTIIFRILAYLDTVRKTGSEDPN